MLIIFDLDGTLFRSHICILTAVHAALRTLSLPDVTDEHIMTLIGEKYVEFGEGIAPGFNDFERLFEIYTQSEYDTIRHEASLFDGAMEMLKSLRAEGHKTALCSNGSMEYIELALSATGITDLFDLVVSGGDYPSKTQAVADIMSRFPDLRAIVAGDRYHDLLAAKENGLPAIAACYGYGPESELLSADYKAASPSDIMLIIREISSPTTA